MKTANQTFKHLILIGLIVSTSISESFGQVITRVLSPGDKIENYIPWFNPNEEVPIVNTPFVDVEAVLLEDQQTGREMPRIGIKQDVNYTVEDGRLIEKGNYSLWSMTLRSANAKSMSVRFDNSNLPENAVMYLFNEESRFIVGPIKKRDFRNGTFRSDYLNGDHVSIQVFIPRNESIEELSTNISSYDHGIIPFRVFDDNFEDSEPCNVNVACEQGVGWECQSESVCKIIHSSIGSCTGSLINNDCCDLTPFVLTADHCIAGFPVDDYLYRFNYQSPQCEPNGETPPSQWITYFGSEVRARWGATDFGLVELFDRPSSNMSFAGWDRTNQTPPNSTFIHHPSGDVKKISFDNGASTLTANFYNFNLTPGMNGDFGTLEGGSSGCPKYNPDQRIIGQQSGGFPQTILCTTTNSVNEDGRFDISWQGNGTPDSRLRDWLGASANPNTMDCMEHPFIEGPDVDVICSEESKQVALINNMPCTKDVQWELSPARLFNSPSTGTGNAATVQASPHASGSANITFTLSSEGCDDVELEKSFWIGSPEDLSFDGIYGNMFICVGATEQYFVLLEDLLEQGVTNYFWSVFPSSKLQIVSSHINQNDVFVLALEPGFAQINFHATNRCGTTVSTLDVIISRNCHGGGGIGFRSSSITFGMPDFKVNVFPNPAKAFIEIACSSYIPGTRIAARIISTDGKAVRTLEEYSHNFKVDVGDLPSGLYVLQLNVNGTIFHEKIVEL